MRRLEVLVDDSRRQTDNLDYSTTSGLQQEEFVRYGNDAQDRIQSLITMAHPSGVFEKEKVITLTSGTSEYDIPWDCYLGNRIVDIAVSASGNERDYYTIKARKNRERTYGVNGVPEFYTRKGSKLILTPSPQSSSAKIKVTYQKAVPRLDLRRGSVNAVTLNNTNNTITSLSLVTGATLDTTGLSKDNYLTIADKNGVIKMTRIPYDSISSITGVVTVSAGFTFESGESIASGDYVFCGPNSSNVSQLPDNCEKYLVSYMNLKVLKRDSSGDSSEQTQELTSMEQEIVGAFGEADRDVIQVPILDAGFLDTDPYY
jgi:hypothetical protein